MNELTRRCLYLPKEDKIRLINLLQDSIDDCTDDGSRFSILLKMATEVVGEGILTKSREFKRNLGRQMIAYQMRKEGYTLSAIAKRLVRNHATIVHMIHVMDDVMKYPNCFKLEKTYWDEFKRKLEYYDIHGKSDQGS